MLITSRALLGIAGATLTPSTLSLIFSMFPDLRQRKVAIGIWITRFSAGGAIGPVLGGVLLAGRRRVQERADCPGQRRHHRVPHQRNDNQNRDRGPCPHRKRREPRGKKIADQFQQRQDPGRGAQRGLIPRGRDQHWGARHGQPALQARQIVGPQLTGRMQPGLGGQPGPDLTGKPRVGVSAAGEMRHDRADGRPPGRGLSTVTSRWPGWQPTSVASLRSTASSACSCPALTCRESTRVTASAGPLCSVTRPTPPARPGTV
jgi:hypothetical protein